jgi:hypothetical protein
MSIPDLMKYFPCVPYVPPPHDVKSAFDALWEATLKNGAGSVIDYRCPYPKHEFLTYLVEQKGLLLHGSNYPQIKVLLPMRFSEGIGYGNLEALYACSDGVWCIYYAIAHRDCPKGSLKSYCFRIKDPDGTAKKYYYFSLHEDMHKSQPWTDGMIYILPRTTFRQLRNELDQPVEEWASEEPVAAIAKLPVSPEDFPFLHCVQSHGNEAPAPAAVRFATNYEAYVGRYTFSGDMSIDVTKHGDSLFVKFPGYPPAALTPVSPNSFRLRPLDIQVAFTNNEPCKPSQLALRLNGQNWVAHKLL